MKKNIISKRTISKPRNYISIALQNRSGSGSGVHRKSNKALRRKMNVENIKQGLE